MFALITIFQKVVVRNASNKDWVVEVTQEIN